MNNRLVVMSVFAAGLGAFYFYADGGIDQLSHLLNQDKAEKRSSPTLASEKVVPVTQTAGTALNPQSELTPDSIAVSINRPLFNQTRQQRPAAPPEQPEPPPVEQVIIEETPAELPTEDLPQQSDYSLLAIASGPNRRVAAVRINNSNTVVYVSQGQAIAKWDVMDVGEREIKIGRDDKSITLKLFAGEFPQESAEPQQEQ